MSSKAWALDDRQQLHRDANAALEQNLMPGETVRVIIRGNYDSAMIGTDRRVFVFKKGFLSGAGMGSKLSSWDYRNLGGIQLETGMLSGTVALQGPGIESKDASSGGDANKSPHALGLANPHFDPARRGVAVLRSLIAESQATRPAAPDAAEQLRKLGELHGAGILTDAEFEAKKAELLARL